MAELRLSVEAARDLDTIRTDGIERFGQAAADRHVRGIRQGIALLAEHPYAGQARPEFRQDIRTISKRPHRILYTATDDLVIVVRVLHHLQDVRRSLAADQ